MFAVATVLLTKYYLGDQMEKNEIGRAWCMYGERRGVNKVLVRKPEGRRSLRRPRHRWKYIIKMDLYEVRCVGTDWTDVAEDRHRWRALVNAVMNLRFL